MMRILHILDHSVPLQSGYSFRTWSILQHQRELGWETFHVTGQRHAVTELLEEDHADLHFFRTPATPTFWNHLPLFRHIAAISALEHRVEALAQSLKPDILHAHSPALNGIAALRVGKRLGIPVVYEVRAFWEDAAVSHGTSAEKGLRYRLTRGLESHVLKKAAAVTVICEGLRQEITGRGILPGKVTIIPNAVNIDKFSQTGAISAALKAEWGVLGKTVLGFIGSFYSYEGVDLLIRALPKITEKLPDVVILLVGGGPEDAALRRLAQDLGLADQVIFTGRVPHEQAESYYHLIDLFVYPRLAIRLTDLVTPLKPLEAMACGIPVAASDVGGHRELIKDGQTGFLFPSGSPDKLAATILKLLSGSIDLTRVCQNASRFVKQERNWPRSVSRYESVYKKVMSAANKSQKPR